MINIKYSYIVRNKIHFIIVTDKKKLTWKQVG